MPAVSKKQREPVFVSNEYAAGFFDGEGYVTIRRSNRYLRKNPSYRLVVGLVNTDLAILCDFQATFGGRLYRKANHAPSLHSQGWELLIQNRDEVNSFLHAVAPCARIKAGQVQLAIDFLRLGLVRKEMIECRGKTWPIFKAVLGEMELREDYKLRLGNLNRRGPCLQKVLRNVVP